jgi:crossover junction endodeoxyribonuclease RuvC
MPTSAAAVRRVLGIDPGLGCTGYGIVDVRGSHLDSVSWGALKAPARFDFFRRLRFIRDGLTEVIAASRPAEMAVEEIFVHRNVQSALTLGHARCAAIMAGLEQDLKPFEYTALQVKKAVVGYGLADKAQVQMMVRQILRLTETPRPEDASDALAVAITHAYVSRAAGTGLPGRTRGEAS